MSKHIFRGLGAILTLTLLVIFTAVPVLAFDARTGETVTVASREVVDDDLYTAANIIIVDGAINGDLWAVARMITTNGPVNGSIMAAAQAINISGDVDHAVRVAGQTINITGNINGDVMAAGADVYIADTARIKGDLLFAAGNVRVDGPVEGDIKGGGQSVTIGNEVGGNVKIEVENLTILPTAVIKGNLTYTSKKKADTHSGAQISGTTMHNVPKVEEKEEEEKAKAPPRFSPFSGVGKKVIGFLMAIIVGLVIILVAPRRIASIADAIRTRTGPSAGWGALLLFITPIAAIIVCITIIGIPLGLITLGLWGIALYLAQIPVGLLIGRLIIDRFRGVEGKAIMVGALALGLVILNLIGLIPVFGFIVGVAVAIFGMGAGIALLRKQRAEARQAASTEP